MSMSQNAHNNPLDASLLDQVVLGDCRDHLESLEDRSVHLFLSDIPYGINLDTWDVLHSNTNSALLGQSPAQRGKPAFKRRGKPINGWCRADRRTGTEYQAWCRSWARLVQPKMKPGASLFVFGARRTLHRLIIAFEDAGFLLKDVLAWKKGAAHHRAQRISKVFDRRGLPEEAARWHGWRLGNLAPAYEPVAWFMNPYRIGGTLADNVLEHEVGAMNLIASAIDGTSPTNLLEFDFAPGEIRWHEAQKPLKLIEFLVKLTTREGQVVLDPFMGSGTTAVAARRLGRHFIGFEIEPATHRTAVARIEREAPGRQP